MDILKYIGKRDRIWFFDMDGTLCEMFYGKTCPEYYTDEQDAATRTLFTNTYEYTKPIEPARELVTETLQKQAEIERNAVIVLTTCANSAEYENKLWFFMEKFMPGHSPSGAEPVISKKNLVGTRNDEDKIRAIKEILHLVPAHALYFDDTIATAIRVEEEVNGHDGKKVTSLHASTLMTREKADFDRLFEEMEMLP